MASEDPSETESDNHVKHPIRSDATSEPGPCAKASLQIVGAAVLTQGLVWGLLWEVFGVARIGYWFFDLSDIGYYYGNLVGQVAVGLVPFRDFFIEDPPFFVPLMLAPGTAVSEMTYAHRFALLMVGFMALACVLVGIAAFSAHHRSRAFLAVGVFSVYTLLLGPIAANRYDAAVAAVLAGTILAMVRERWTIAGLLVGVGVALKITPFIFLPLVLVLAPRRSLWRPLVAFAVAAALPFLWVLGEGGQAAANLGRMISYHLARPLEIESVLAVPFWLGRLLGVSAVKVGQAAGSQVILSAWADRLATLSAIVLIAGLGFAYFLVWRKRRVVAANPSALFLAVLVVLLASLVGSKVLSPQYFVWIVPSVALVALDRPLPGVLVGLALLFTQWLFPGNYWAFAADQAPAAIAIVVARNLLLVGAFVVCLWDLWSLADKTEGIV